MFEMLSIRARPILPQAALDFLCSYHMLRCLSQLGQGHVSSQRPKCFSIAAASADWRLRIVTEEGQVFGFVLQAEGYDKGLEQRVTNLEDTVSQLQK